MSKRRKNNADGSLNSQQWQVYNYLKEHGKVGAYELALNCGYWFDEDAQKRNLSRISMALYQDVTFINNSPMLEKPILWEVKDKVMTYWLAESYEQVKEFVYQVYFDSAFTKLKKGWGLLKKVEKNGQGKLIDLRNNPIDGTTRAREFVESYWKGIVDND